MKEQAIYIVCYLPEHSTMRRFLYNPYPADHDYCRFQSVLLVDHITVIGNEMCV